MVIELYASMLKEIVHGKTAQDRNTVKSVNSNIHKKYLKLYKMLSLLVTDILARWQNYMAS